MFTPLIPPRGDSAKNAAHVGAEGSITVNTSLKTIHVHDGVTPGGQALSKVGHSHAANEVAAWLGYVPAALANGKVLTSQLGSGTADETTFLSGDGTWKVVQAGGSGAAADLTGTTLATNVVNASLESIAPNNNLSLVPAARAGLHQGGYGVTITGGAPSGGSAGGGSVTIAGAGGGGQGNGGNVNLTGGTGSGSQGVSGSINLTAGVSGFSKGSINLKTNGVNQLVIDGTGLATFTGDVVAASFAGDGSALTALNAAALASGVVPVARLASSGTASTTTFLRGDGTWAAPTTGATNVLNGTAAPNVTSATSGTYAGMGGYPYLRFVNSGLGTDAKGINIYGDSGNGGLYMGFLGDTMLNQTIFMSVTRSGQAALMTTFTTQGMNLALGTDGLRINNSAGTAGQVLTSGGAGAAPSWTTVSTTSLAATSTYTLSATKGVYAGTNTIPHMRFVNSSVGADGRNVVIGHQDNGNFTMQHWNDANSSGDVFLRAVRSAATSTLVTLTGNSVNFAGLSTGLQLNGSAGTAGQVLTSAGGSAAPTWQTLTASVSSLQATSASGVTSATTGIYIGSASGRTAFNLVQQTASADQKVWNITAPSGTSGTLQFNMLPDDLSAEVNWMSVTRSGATASQIQLTASAINLSGLATGLKLNNSAGTAGQVLTSQGPSAAPTWTTITASVGNTVQASAGAVMSVAGGAPASATGASGGLNLYSTTAGTTSGNSGAINITSGDTWNGVSGQITIRTGSLNAGSGSGALLFNTGGAGPTGASGRVDFYTGAGGSTSGNSGLMNLYTGTTTSGASGAFLIATGNAAGVAGNISLTGGASSTGAAGGSIQLIAGNSSTAANAGVISLTTATVERLRITAAGAWGLAGAANTGTTGQVLTSQGNAAAPIWANNTATVVTANSAVTRVATTSGIYMGTVGGNPVQTFVNSTPAAGSRVMTNWVDTSGTYRSLFEADDNSGGVAWLTVTRSGTTAPLITLAATGINLAVGATGLQVNGSAGTSGQVLTSNGSAAPTWQTLSVSGGTQLSATTQPSLTNVPTTKYSAVGVTSGGLPILQFSNSSAAVDNRLHLMQIENTGELAWYLQNDAVNTATRWMSVLRSGTTASSVSITTTSFNLPTGLMTLGVNATVPGVVAGADVSAGNTAAAGLTVRGGHGNSSNVNAGSLVLSGGNYTSTNVGPGGNATLKGGDATGSGAGLGGNVFITGGVATGAAGGYISLSTSAAAGVAAAERLRVTSAGVISTNAGTSVDFGGRYTELNNTGTATATYNIDALLSNVHTLTMSAAITSLTFSNLPASGRAFNLTLILTQDATGGRAVTWPASVKWAGGIAPTLSGASKTDIITLLTTNGGTTWFGFVGGLNF